MERDWRGDISDCESLMDIDPIDNLIFLRHMYLCAAKDMMLPYRNIREDQKVGLQCLQAAEALEEAIEVQLSSLDHLLNFGPSY
jgi:hypothetical protein